MTDRSRVEPPAETHTHWQVLVVEESHSEHSVFTLLARTLDDLEAAGYGIRFVLPNGVNRYTVIARLGQA